MNNNRYFQKIIEILSTETRIKSIVLDGDDLQTADLNITFKAGKGTHTVVFSYHGVAKSITGTQVSSAQLRATTATLQRIEDALRGI